MDITTNRVDAMNHYGIAREAATIYNLPLSPLDRTTESSFRPEAGPPDSFAGWGGDAALLPPQRRDLLLNLNTHPAPIALFHLPTPNPA
jgi:hypothetical protein